MKFWVINWDWSNSGGTKKCYVFPGQPNRKPYTPKVLEAKRWKTLAAAQHFLSLKTPGWAANCVIEEHEA